MKLWNRNWGREYVLGSGDRVIRIYDARKRVTIDLSQVRDKDWPLYQSIVRKYGQVTKITHPAGTPVQPILEWFEENQ